MNTLPTKGLPEVAEKCGIKVLGPVDNLFTKVELPSGWSVVPTDHSMWSKLVDDTGKPRANIFYKGAFYDRYAHIHLVGQQ